MTSNNPLVVVFSLGGTIAMTPQAAGTVTPTLSGSDLVAGVPGLSELDVRIEVNDFRRLPGASLSFADLYDLAREISVCEADGVVVTQGTDTIEETAFLIELLHDSPKPVVFTGAMRNASMAGADGPANVLAAVKVAASPDAREIGCVVVFGEEIHAARFIRKVHTSSPTAFASYPGPIGYVAEDAVRFWTRLSPIVVAPPVIERQGARTAVVPVLVGDDGEVLRAVGDKVDGLVVAAFGAGHVPESCVEPLTELAKRMPVVLTSRTGSGPVLTRTYGFTGSESDLLARGLIHAGTLDPWKARILLHVVLTAGLDSSAVVAAFENANTHHNATD